MYTLYQTLRSWEPTATESSLPLSWQFVNTNGALVEHAVKGTNPKWKLIDRALAFFVPEFAWVCVDYYRKRREGTERTLGDLFTQEYVELLDYHLLLKLQSLGQKGGTNIGG